MSRKLFGGGRGAKISSCLIAGLALTIPASANAVDPGARGPSAAERAAKPYLDTRDGTSARGADSRLASPDRARAARAALRDRLGAQGVVDVDPLTDTPRLIQRLDGAVSGPRDGDPVAIARAWARHNRAALGLSAAAVGRLRLEQAITPTQYGITHLRFSQRDHGIPAFDNGLRVSLADDGRILSVTGAPTSAAVPPSSASADRAVPAARPASRAATSPAWCCSAPPPARASPGT